MIKVNLKSICLFLNKKYCKWGLVIFVCAIYLLIFTGKANSNRNKGQNTDEITKITEYANRKTKETINSLEEERIEYEIWIINYKKKIYEYQYFSGQILLFISITVLVCGLYFSYVQFSDRINSNRLNNHGSENLENNDNDKSKTSLKIGAAGIEISSSIIGLLILCVSLAFFYLYIANIYPIEGSENGGKGKLPSSILMESKPSPSPSPLIEPETAPE